MSGRGPSYFFLDLIEKYIGKRCWYSTAAFVAIVGGTASIWVPIWIVVACLFPPVTAVHVRCWRRRAEERRAADHRREKP